MDRAWAPWAFAKGDPKKVIAALELLATLVGIRLWVPEGKDRKSSRASGHQGLHGQQIQREGYDDEVSSMLILMETAEELSHRNCELQLQWIRRDINQLADNLTNEEFKEFDPELRIDLDGKSFKWRILDRLLAHADSFYSELGTRMGCQSLAVRSES